MDDLHLRIIIEWIANAWAQLIVERACDVASDEEDGITALLLPRLRNLLADDDLLSDLVTAVHQSVCTDYTGGRLRKAPDISIDLTDRSRPFPLHIEAKIIDDHKRVDLYCTNGIARFVAGEYGWASREGMMIAYVRNGAAIKPTLTAYLTTHGAGYQTQAPPDAVAGCCGDVARSRHDRSFTYVHADGQPGNITLWHLWLAAAS